MEGTTSEMTKFLPLVVQRSVFVLAKMTAFDSEKAFGQVAVKVHPNQHRFFYCEATDKDQFC